MPDEKQVLKDELNQLVETLRTEVKAHDANFLQTNEFKTFEEKVTKAQKEIVAKLAELQKPMVKIEKGDVEKPVDPVYTKEFFKMVRGQEYEKKALVADATGRILLPEELEATIYTGLPQLNVIRPLCSVMTTTRDRVRGRSMSAPVVAWGKLELGAAVPNTTLVPVEAYWYPEDLNGLVQVGVDELADTDTNLSAYISEQFLYAIANAEERAFAIGVGHTAQQPAGIFATASGVTTVDTTASGAVIFEDIKTVIANVPPQYRQGAVFLMHTNTGLALQVLRASGDGTHLTGEFLWQPSLIADQPDRLCGYPVYYNDSIAQVGDGTLQKVVAFGNFKYGYKIIDRQGMSLKQLNELYITSGLVGFLATRRVTGGVMWPDAIRILAEHA